jgi:ABC-type uncharacterized transport system fused permease/ATPase subunit
MWNIYSIRYYLLFLHSKSNYIAFHNGEVHERLFSKKFHYIICNLKYIS